jgi:hypothetical protein
VDAPNGTEAMRESGLVLNFVMRVLSQQNIYKYLASEEGYYSEAVKTPPVLTITPKFFFQLINRR